MTKLTEQQKQTLHDAVDRIIPADEYPGAWESGVGDYLERQFETGLRPMVDDYCGGLTALEAESIARFQRGFTGLSADEQDEMLRHIEAGEVLTTWKVAPFVFFNLLVSTTAEGYYSDPEQGGNRNRVSWTMTGFEEGSKS